MPNWQLSWRFNKGAPLTKNNTNCGKSNTNNLQKDGFYLRIHGLLRSFQNRFLLKDAFLPIIRDSSKRKVQKVLLIRDVLIWMGGPFAFCAWLACQCCVWNQLASFKRGCSTESVSALLARWLELVIRSGRGQRIKLMDN